MGKDFDRVGSGIGPNDPLEPSKKDTPLDVEKFKKVLKVEESDETQKRFKRRKKSDEEIEDEEVQGQTTQTPAEATVSFSEFMKDEKKGIDPFAEQAKTPMKRMQREEGVSFIEEKKPPGVEGPSLKGAFVSEEEQERFTAGLPSAPPREGAEPPPQEAPPAPLPPQAGQPPLPPATEEYFEIEEPAQAEPEQQQPGAKEKKGPEPAKRPPSKETEKKQPGAALPLKKAEAEELLEGKIPAPEKKTLETEKKAPSQKPSPEKAEPPSLSIEEKEKFFQKFHPKGAEELHTEEQEKIEEIAAAPAESPAEAMVRKGKEKEEELIISEKGKKEKEAFHLQEEAAPSQVDVAAPPPFEIPSAAPPAYSTLSPQMFELFERMVGLITIESERGVTRTTVTINMKNSVFDGSQIILDHYSTAPHAFNVTLAGSPQAISYFNANISDLTAAFKQSQFSFEVNLQRPILLEQYRSLKKEPPKVKRKKESEEKPE